MATNRCNVFVVLPLSCLVIWPLETRFDVEGTASGKCAVTHVILWGPLKRTEKYLCAVAAGMWLLHPGKSLPPFLC